MSCVARVLITGANKGLGKHAAQRLLTDGHDVWVAARDPSRARETAEELGGKHVVLDVTDDASVASAVETVAVDGGLDVLVNNAGIAGARRRADEVTAEDVRDVFDVNVFGAIRVLHAFLPLLKRSSAPVVVNVSSGLGSLVDAVNPESAYFGLVNPAYCSSKAALNMLTVQYAKAFPKIRINAVDPGFTATDLNEHRGVQSVEEGTDAIVAMVSIGPDGPTATFADRRGRVAW
jgi:NAD(P)-dependent dehydrogenase (short-subunit alcohol dehydrogenase family)